MSPASSYTSTSCGSLPITGSNQLAPAPQPPSGQALNSLTTKIANVKLADVEYLSMLPTMLFYTIKTWLNDTQSLQLALTSHVLHDLVQGLYKLQLRKTVAQILRCHAVWDWRVMGGGIAALCQDLGGVELSPDCRDTVLETILASSKTSSPAQMSAMIWSVVHVLGGSEITLDNLDAVTSRIFKSPGTSSKHQLEMMIQHVVHALGQTNITEAHRLALVAQIQKSARMREILDVLETIKVTPVGYQIVSLLQIETAGDTVKNR